MRNVSAAGRLELISPDLRAVDFENVAARSQPRGARHAWIARVRILWFPCAHFNSVGTR